MLTVQGSVLVVIDVQEKLFPAMFETETLLSNLHKMIKGSGLLGVPVIFTEQNPAGLGKTLPELSGLNLQNEPITKFDFNCCSESSFIEALNCLNRRNVMVCGIEAHICVYQTSMDLLLRGFQVHLVGDCVSSRTSKNRELALRRLESEGVKLTGVEMALFELLRSSKSPQFKAISSLIK
ncbi:Nicotinamidase-related amidase [Dehalogenimonas formicexedens]|uniref:Nicotinamidase-related amidase n=1 Tax=Dehalogenimonas formicexedens TaxID=1839801 RepID=A0A1P8F6A7_9CHLR|nr:hydrolase [Dehalogenimonas formicexedens]APV44014.1 Nicotinamidase-related amidase [Dehalogenimonas formicexedens]